MAEEKTQNAEVVEGADEAEDATEAEVEETEDVEEQDATEDVEVESNDEAEAEADAEVEETTEPEVENEPVVDEAKEANDQPSDITKLEKRIEALEEQLAERVEKVAGDFAKAEAMAGLEARITKLEKQPVPVKAAQAYTVVNKSIAGAQETTSRVDEINKRLAEIDAIRDVNLGEYQSKYMQEALALVEEKRQIETHDLRGGENE